MDLKNLKYWILDLDTLLEELEIYTDEAFEPHELFSMAIDIVKHEERLDAFKQANCLYQSGNPTPTALEKIGMAVEDIEKAIRYHADTRGDNDE